MNFIYAPTNKIKTSKYNTTYEYAALVETKLYTYHFSAYVKKSSDAIYLYDYTKYLQTEMSKNKNPDEIYNMISWFDFQLDGVEQINIEGLSLTRAIEIIDKNIEMITKFNSYSTDYYLIKELTGC